MASLVSRSMLETLELRERLKEFSRLSVAAVGKHRSTAQVDTMQGVEGGGASSDNKREREGVRENYRKQKEELQEL